MPVRLITPRRFDDDRGWFEESYSRRAFAALGLEVEFVQDNHSFSGPAGVVRGLHFQRPPSAQAKLVRCVRGKIWDVAVDIRGGSPTFGEWVSAELSAKNGRQIFIPIGFAHGLITLEPDTEVEYKVTAFYDPAAEGGIMWNDVDLALPWPFTDGGAKLEPILSLKDAELGAFKDFESPFDYDGQPLAPLAG